MRRVLLAVSLVVPAIGAASDGVAQSAEIAEAARSAEIVVLGEKLAVGVKQLEHGVDGGQAKLYGQHGEVQRLTRAGIYDKSVLFLFDVE